MQIEDLDISKRKALLQQKLLAYCKLDAPAMLERAGFCVGHDA